MGVIKMKYGLAEIELATDRLESSELVSVILEVLLQANRDLTNQEVRVEALSMIEELQLNLGTMKTSHRIQARIQHQQSALVEDLRGGIDRLLQTLDGVEGLSTSVKAAVHNMQEMNMSFNMQYLQLQQKMQDESRRFTLLSNIMKTKHDTAKNSISNIR